MEKFNLFKNLKLNEDTHTRLLKRLLHPKGSHNQETLFLKSFIIDVLKGEFNENEDWYINDQEKAGVGTADLVIRTKNSSCIYIIENKIRGAVDQDSQLYRYWRNIIYPVWEKENTNELAKPEDFHLNSDKYKIAYLSRVPITNNQKNKALIKPNSSNDKYKDFPCKLPIPITYISYSNEIYSWLEQCLDQIQGNEELFFTLKQYIDWIKLYDN